MELQVNKMFIFLNLIDHNADVDETNLVVSQNLLPADGNSISGSDVYADTNCSDQDDSLVNETPSLQDLSARYILKIKKGNQISNKAAQNIVSTTSLLFSVAFEKLEKKIIDSLTQVGFDIQDVPGIDEAFDEFSSPFDGLMSTWSQSQYLKHDPKFVVCSQCYDYIAITI